MIFLILITALLGLITTFYAFYDYIRLLLQQKVRVGRISPLQLALYDVKVTGTLYGGKYHYHFTSTCIRVQFHLPTPTNPRWMTSTLTDILYKSETCDASIGWLLATFWFFPLLFRQTAGPWMNMELDDVRIRVQHSSATPHFVKLFRETIVGTILTGEILRADLVGTKLRTHGLTEGDIDKGGYNTSSYHESTGEDMREADTLQSSVGASRVDEVVDGGSDRSETRSKVDSTTESSPAFLSRDQDEVTLSAYARGLHVNNKEGRIYTFGSMDAQLRRNWSADRGTFVMIAKESRWIKVHWEFERHHVRSWWLQLFSSMVSFPFDLVHALRYPMSFVNLYISRADITFDNFQLRDAELVAQAISITREKMIMSDIDWSNVFFDTVAHAITRT